MDDPNLLKAWNQAVIRQALLSGGHRQVEQFNQVVDSFLAESVLEKPKTLDQLNGHFNVWLEECYQHKITQCSHR